MLSPEYICALLLSCLPDDWKSTFMIDADGSVVVQLFSKDSPTETRESLTISRAYRLMTPVEFLDHWRPIITDQVLFPAWSCWPEPPKRASYGNIAR